MRGEIAMIENQIQNADDQRYFFSCLSYLIIKSSQKKVVVPICLYIKLMMREATHQLSPA